MKANAEKAREIMGHPDRHEASCMFCGVVDRIAAALVKAEARGCHGTGYQPGSPPPGEPAPRCPCRAEGSEIENKRLGNIQAEMERESPGSVSRQVRIANGMEPRDLYAEGIDEGREKCLTMIADTPEWARDEAREVQTALKDCPECGPVTLCFNCDDRIAAALVKAEARGLEGIGEACTALYERMTAEVRKARAEGIEEAMRAVNDAGVPDHVRRQIRRALKEPE